jgi:predicted Zn-dependent peptidase
MTRYYLTRAGAAHMLAVTAFGGTMRVSGLRLIRDLETMGAQISSSSDREKVIYLTVNSTFIPICAKKLKRVLMEEKN